MHRGGLEEKKDSPSGSGGSSFRTCDGALRNWEARFRVSLFFFSSFHIQLYTSLLPPLGFNFLPPHPFFSIYLPTYLPLMINGIFRFSVKSVFIYMYVSMYVPKTAKTVRQRKTTKKKRRRITSLWLNKHARIVFVQYK